MPAMWFSCTTLPLGTGVRQQNFPRTRGLRETTLRNPGVRRFVLKLVRLMLVRPTFYLPQVRFATYSPYSRRHFRTSSTSPTSLTSEIQNEAIHRAISENAEQPCDRHQPIKLLVTNHLCNICFYCVFICLSIAVLRHIHWYKFQSIDFSRPDYFCSDVGHQRLG